MTKADEWRRPVWQAARAPGQPCAAMIADHSPSRRAGNASIVAQAQRQVQTFFDELKNSTRNYRTVASLDAQITQAYRGRCILELLQNAHDALANTRPDDPLRISFVLSTASEPVLLIGNSGRPFLTKDFQGISRYSSMSFQPSSTPLAYVSGSTMSSASQRPSIRASKRSPVTVRFPEGRRPRLDVSASGPLCPGRFPRLRASARPRRPVAASGASPDAVRSRPPPP